jgi:hypothetical protein
MSDTLPNNDVPERIDDGLDFLDAEVLVEDRAFGSVYPVLQWINGKAVNKAAGGISHTGGFFISSEQGVEIPGFEPHTLITSDGTEVEGHASRDVDLSVIRIRKSWNVQPAEGKGLSQRYGYDEYDEAQAAGDARGSTHILVCINGLKEPLMLAVSGYTARALGAAGQGRDRGIVPRFASKVVNSANRMAKRAGKQVTYPLCAFSIKVGPKRDDKGKPHYDEVGTKKKSSVTLPVWLDEPKAVDGGYLKNAYVGHELFMALQGMHQAADEWVSAWDSESLSTLRNKGKKPEAPQAEGEGEAGGNLPAKAEMPF